MVAIFRDRSPARVPRLRGSHKRRFTAGFPPKRQPSFVLILLGALIVFTYHDAEASFRLPRKRGTLTVASADYFPERVMHSPPVREIHAGSLLANCAVYNDRFEGRGSNTKNRSLGHSCDSYLT